MHAHRLDIDEWSLGRPSILEIQVNAMIEISVAGGIVVEPDDIRRTRILGEPQDVALRDLLPRHVLKHRMMPIHATA